MTVQTTSPTANRPSRPGSPAPAASAIDPIRILRQHLTLFITTGIVGLVLGVGVYVVWLTFFPSYRGVATFELVGELGSADDPIARENRNEDTIQRLAGTEAAKAIDEEILRAVLKDVDVQRMAWSDQFRDENGTFLEEDALVELQDEIRASYRRRTQFFDVVWSAYVATDVPVLLNAVSQRYLDRRDEERTSMRNQAKGPFLLQLDGVNREIAVLDNEISDDITRQGMLSLDQGASTLQKDLEDRELELNEVMSELQNTQQLLVQIDQKLAGSAEPSQDDIREAEQDPVILRTLGDIQTLRGLVAEHRQKFGADHQQVRESQRALDARIREKDRKVEEVVFRNLQGQRKLASDAIERLAAVEQALEAEIEEKSGRLIDFVAQLADLEKKRADLDRKEDRRTRIQEQIDGIDAMFARKDAEQIRPANSIRKPLEPASPQWYIAIPGTAVLLLGFVGGVVFLRELLDKRVRSTSDLTALPGMRLLGVIPDLKDDPTEVGRAESIIRDSPASVVAESHRQFAAAFRRAREDAGARSILFIGGMPESGTTAVVSNLAVIAASVGRKVALVDGNLRRPRVAEVFGLDPQEPGLGDVMCGAASLDSVIQTTQEGLRVVTAGTPANRTFERLDSDQLRMVVDELLKQVDVVFVDGPPAVVAGEAMGMADQVDATLLVVRAYSEQRGLVARLARQLREQPSTFLGVVLNRPRNTAGGYFKRNYEAIASYASDKD
jgi:capsular exopolysaccharide synthesis family protein